jgi:hypothetical protein
MKLIAHSVMAAAMLGAATGFAADSNNFQLRDTADLVRVCNVPRDDAHYLNATGFCHGVLVGAYRYYDSTVKAANRFICPPNPIPTRAKVMGEFVKWANANPKYMKDAAMDTLFRYLAETYPCAK